MLIASLIVIIVCLLVVVIVLITHLYLYREALKDIVESTDYVLHHDTNLVIDYKTNNKYLVKLVKLLNKDIVHLKRLINDCRIKDTELRECFANISHDFRTPLTIVNSYINFIEKTDKSLTPKTAEGLAIIRDRINAMVVLVEDLLTYSIAVNEEIQLDYSYVSLNDCLEETIAAFYELITERDLTVSLNITSIVVVRYVDVNEFKRVLCNIIMNAIKYSDGDLVITLDADGMMLFSNHASNLDKISVGKLFNRFFTVADGRKKTGLGLSIAKVLTERMGGVITALYNNGILTIKLGEFSI